MADLPSGTFPPAVVVVELIDPWHEPGYRAQVARHGGGMPETIRTVVVGDVSEHPDPVTRLRPSDRVTGRYVRDGLTEDEVPRYRWEPLS